MLSSNKTSDQEQLEKENMDSHSKVNDGASTSSQQHDNAPRTKEDTSLTIKWTSTVIVALMFLAFLTQSKVSIIALSENMHRNAAKPDKSGIQEACRMFVMLFLIILIPNCFNFIRGLSRILFNKNMSWPSKTTFGLGFVLSASETFGICVFVMKVPSMTQPRNMILLMNSVMMIPIFMAFCLKENCKGGDRRKRMGIALLVELAGICLTTYIWKNSSTSLYDVMYIVCGVICLSGAWLPELVKYAAEDGFHSQGCRKISPNPKTSKQLPKNLQENSTTPPNPPRSFQGNQTTKENTEYMHENGTEEPSALLEDEDDEDEYKNSKNLNKAQDVVPVVVTFMSFCKIIFTFSFSFLLLRYSVFRTDAADVVIYHFRIGLQGWQGKGLYYFISNCLSGLFGYVAGFIACTSRMKEGSYVLPLFLATPLTGVLLAVKTPCDWLLIGGMSNGTCDLYKTPDVLLFITAVVCFALANLISFGFQIIESQTIVMQKESQLFWFPTYNSCLLEEWLWLSLRNECNSDDKTHQVAPAKVYVCTTMYREAEYEMQQLLKSIKKLIKAQCDVIFKQHVKSVEYHILFDGAVNGNYPNDFVLQLLSLVKSSICSRPGLGRKTPYGLSLEWTIKYHGEETKFKIHLKDGVKVKNKKRWSQIMYMSYILQKEEKEETVSDTYILTTDGDVKFTPEAVLALLDLMKRDTSVGAVCARTNPLGKGPVVWYQIFEYAIGHWFQKTAEHVLGSVLCAPGCFSMYRGQAIGNVLEGYSANVENAFDFLTKDMGEDRWLCTLMVRTGWRIEYCAASENSTHCPKSFDEFYKQRRRWIASTIANMWLVIKGWDTVRKNNQHVTILFLLYQVVLLFATLIGPSSVILVVSGALVYGWHFDSFTTLVLQGLMCGVYTLICLFTSQKWQLRAAKFLTFIYSVVMMAVVVGVAVKVATDFSEEGHKTSRGLPISTTTVYLMMTAGIYIITGILHLKESTFLMHSFWYLVCLPSAYLIVIIYSICNITDKSWGTREAKVDQFSHNTTKLQEKVHRLLRRALSLSCTRTSLENSSCSDVERGTSSYQEQPPHSDQDAMYVR